MTTIRTTMSAVFFSRADQTPPPVDHVLLPAQPFHSPSPPCSPRPHSRHTSPTRYIVPTINGRVVRGFGRAFLYLSIYLSIYLSRAARSCTRRRPGSARSDGTSPWIARASTARVRHCCPPHPPPPPLGTPGEKQTLQGMADGSGWARGGGSYPRCLARRTGFDGVGVPGLDQEPDCRGI